MLEISEQCTRSFEECTTSVGQLTPRAVRRNNCTSSSRSTEWISRRSDGCYDQTASRLRYIKHLRSEHRRSPRTEADAAHLAVKTDLLQLRLMEKRRALVRREDVNALIDTMAGTVLTHLSGMAARCSRDLATRRAIDNVVLKIRREIAAVCVAQADAWGEPPLVQQE